MDEKMHHDLFYAEDAERILQSPLMLRLQRRFVMQFVQRAKLGPQSEILSLGCGEGEKEQLLSPHVRRIVGLDISEVAINNARRTCSAANLTNLTFEVADLADAQAALPTGPYDAVCAFSLLHHLGDREIVRLIGAARERLKPGGVFYSLDPNARRFVGLFTGLVRGTYERHHSPDERPLDPTRVRALFRDAGYVCTTVDYVDFFASPFAWLFPGCPRWLTPGLDATDRLLVSLPGVCLFADAFSVVAVGEVAVPLKTERLPIPERS